MSGVPASETRATALLAHPRDQAGPHPIGIMIVIGRHRPLDADMAEQLGGDPAVLDRDQVGARQYVRGARAQIGEIADRGRDDIEAGLKRIVHGEHRHGIAALRPQARPRCSSARRRWLAMARRWLPAACRARARWRRRRAAASEPERAGRCRRAGLPADETRNRVAVLVPLTGANAALGQSILNAANLALLDTGGQRIRITAYDTAAGAAAAANEALADGNGLILGPLLAEDVRAVAPVARRAGVPVIAFSNDVSVAGDGVYLMGFTPAQSIERVVAFARARGASASARWCRPTSMASARRRR